MLFEFLCSTAEGKRERELIPARGKKFPSNNSSDLRWCVIWLTELLSYETIMIKLLLNRNRPPRIDLFSLYILFSHFRPLDSLKGIFLLFFFSSYAYICTCISRHLKKLFSRLASRGLKWENKTYKLKRSNCLNVFPIQSSWEITFFVSDAVLKTTRKNVSL